MASTSRCLLDAPVLAEAVRCGVLGDMCRAHRIATGELVVASLTHQRTRMGTSCSVALAELMADGRIEVLSATATELAEVVRWVGSWAMCSAELELVALALAGKGRVCTSDAVVRRAIRELGIEDRWVGVAELFGENRSTDSDPVASKGQVGDAIRVVPCRVSPRQRSSSIDYISSLFY